MSTESHPVDVEILFDCLRPTSEQRVIDLLERLPEQGWRDLLALGERSRIGAVLARRLLAPPFQELLPEPIELTLKELRWASRARALALHEDFRQLIPALQAAGIPVIALKGLHLAGPIYGDSAVREMADIDLLIPVRQLASAAAAVQDLGYKPAAPYRIRAGPVPFPHHHLPRFQRLGETSVELHWNICKPGSGPEVDIDQLWEQAVTAKVAGLGVAVLSPEDLLLHVCIHATYGHLCRDSVRPWCDIAEITRRHERSLSWEKVVTQAQRWRCRRGVYLALRLAGESVEAAVPGEVLGALKPPGFDEEVLSIAVKQGDNRELPLGVAQFWEARSMAAKLRTLWRQICIQKNDLSQSLGPGTGSGGRYSLYSIRLKEARRHWRTLTSLRRGDFALTTSAQCTLALHQFLSEE